MITIFVSFVFFWSDLFAEAKAFPSCAPLSPVTCITLDPLGHLFPHQHNKKLDYEIFTKKEWFMPNEVIQINISSVSHHPFKGLMVQVRNSNKNAVGNLIIHSEDDFIHLPCEVITANFSDNSTVCHRHAREKEVAFFNWTAPPDCNETTYEVRVTVVKDFRSYQTGITKSLQCRQSPLPPIEKLPSEQDEVPQEASPKCRFDDLTSIPSEKYQTSFEDKQLNGWNNHGWRFHHGNTSTQDTGPTSAFDGETYLYFETSVQFYSPEVILSTDLDLRGCFCLSFAHSHNVDDGKHHYLKVSAGSEVLYSVSKKHSDWNNVSVQVDSEDLVKLNIIGIRGTNNRGDMAIDNFRIDEGLCSEE